MKKGKILMNNKVVNKQIPLETIVKVANYLEKYKEEYDRKFELEQNKNKNIPYGEKQWEYENGNTTINYTIEFKNGKNIKESDYNWFAQNLNQPSIIKSLAISNEYCSVWQLSTKSIQSLSEYRK